MKFYTNEWHVAARRKDLDYGLHADERAERFDEAFYGAMYKEKYQKWYELQRRVHEASAEAFIIRLHKPFLDADEMSQESHDRAIETARQHDANKPPFSPAEEAAKFAAAQRIHLRRYQHLLPPEILAKVADVRLLPLGVASPEVVCLIEECARESKHISRRGSDGDELHLRKIRERIPEDIRENLFALHDVSIERAKYAERSFTLFIASSVYNYARIRSITFHDCQIVHIDEPVEQGLWVHVEFDFLEDGRYEVGIVFHGMPRPDGEEDLDRFYQTIELTAAKVTFEHDEITEEEIQAEKRFYERMDQLRSKGLVGPAVYWKKPWEMEPK